MRSERSPLPTWLLRSAARAAAARLPLPLVEPGAQHLQRLAPCSCAAISRPAGCTTSPVGRWVMRTALSVVLTDWPPGPLARNTSMRRSLSSIWMSTSSASGSTATVAAEVWMRPDRLGLGHALHAVHARFEFEPREHVAAGDRRARLLEAADPGLRQVEQLEAPAVQRGVALVHAEELGGEQRRLLAAGAGAHFEDRVALVVVVLGQQRQFARCFRARAGARAGPAAPPRRAPSSPASSADRAISASDASSSRRRGASAPMSSTIGVSSLYSFDSLANSAPPSPLPPARRAIRHGGAAAGRADIRDRVPCRFGSAQKCFAAAPPARPAATRACSPLSRSRSVTTPRASSSSPIITAARALIRSARRMRRGEIAGIAEIDDEARRAQRLRQTSSATASASSPIGTIAIGRGGAGGSAISSASRSIPAAQPTPGISGPPIISTSPS